VSTEPTRRLAGNARAEWRLEQALVWVIALVGGFLLAGPLDGVLALLVRVVPAVGLVLGLTVVPELRWRRWRWDVSAEAIDIRHGTLTIRRTLIPMSRVQHVDTTSDVIDQRFGLATVQIHTAAGSHKIPLLSTRDADELRDRIAELADAP
jgi:membrane protein YdbS with pleckstrin-like domain